MRRIRTRRHDLLDTCGTGGDASGTFNISTAAAIVAAATGLPIAKHGNRSVTSKSGSSDVLAELGVNIEASLGQVEACLDRLGICFCYAPLMHPSMRQVAAVRRDLALPTIFNLLGPLCNPAAAPYQLLGVGQAEAQPKMAGALQKLGVKRASVVRGDDGLDEVTLDGVTRVLVVTSQQITEQTWSPELFGLGQASKQSMQVNGPQASAQLILRILQGEPGPPSDIVIANAAAALWTAGRGADLRGCASLAREAVETGKAARLLSDLSRVSHAPLPAVEPQ